MRIFMLFTAIACAPDSPAPAAPCPPSPAATCPPPSGAAISPWEEAALADDLTDLRAGARPYGDAGWGLCEGTTTCTRFIGATPTEPLPPGDYILRAHVQLPRLGGGWTTRFDVDCAVTNAIDKVRHRTHSRTYDVTWAGPNRGYPLEPLWRIHSPADDGTQDCTLTLTPIRSDGQEMPAWVSRYQIPRAATK